MIQVFAVFANAAWRGGRSKTAAQLISGIKLAGPLLGLLTGAMNAFHMMNTTLRLTISPTAKMLAPGVMEVATFVALGSLVGLVALTADAFIKVRAPANSPR
jgi:hypothetical protein